jgi:hypothetical protein
MQRHFGVVEIHLASFWCVRRWAEVAACHSMQHCLLLFFNLNRNLPRLKNISYILINKKQKKTKQKIKFQILNKYCKHNNFLLVQFEKLTKIDYK